jgi:hypothetical protein
VEVVEAMTIDCAETGTIAMNKAATKQCLTTLAGLKHLKFI